MQTRPKRKKSKRLVAILNRHRAGDQAALAPLDKACRRRVYLGLQRMLPNAALRAECDDAVQIALFRLVRGTESFGTDQKLIAWLKKTAKRKARNAHRRRRPFPNSPLVESELGNRANNQSG
jgi:DNA-directed RNA polymerase specialized sigma24 family protein